MNTFLKLAAQFTVGGLPELKFWEGGTLMDVITKLLNFLLSLSAALAVLFIVVGGLRYVTAAGSPERVEGAKKTVFNAIIGLAVVILSLVIVNTIAAVIGG